MNVYDVVIEVDPKAEEKVKAAKVTAEEAKEKATIAAIEAEAIADEIAVETAEKVEEAGKKAQETKMKLKAVKKKAAFNSSLRTAMYWPCIAMYCHVFTYTCIHER